MVAVCLATIELAIIIYILMKDNGKLKKWFAIPETDSIQLL